MDIALLTLFLADMVCPIIFFCFRYHGYEIISKKIMLPPSEEILNNMYCILYGGLQILM
jgi:hypothetical protein